MYPIVGGSCITVGVVHVSYLGWFVYHIVGGLYIILGVVHVAYIDGSCSILYGLMCHNGSGICITSENFEYSRKF